MTGNPSRSLIAAVSGLSFWRCSPACSFQGPFKETTDTIEYHRHTSGRIWWNEDGLLERHWVAAFTA